MAPVWALLAILLPMTAATHTETVPPGNIRAYLAGTGATAALVAGALVVFLSLAAFVGFKGLPFGGSSERGDLYLGSNAGAAPEAAAAALGAAPGAVAAAPVPGAPVGVAVLVAGGGTTAVFTGPNGPSFPHGPNGPGGPDNPPGPCADCPVPPPPPGPTVNPDAKRALTGTVQNLDETTGELGLDTNLSGATGGLTRSLDDTLGHTLNGVGGLLGRPHLGDNVGRTGNQLTNRLLGDQGLTGRLLGHGH